MRLATLVVGRSFRNANQATLVAAQISLGVPDGTRLRDARLR